MLDLGEVTILEHDMLDAISYATIIHILDLYELTGLNYRIWTTNNSHFLAWKKNSINYQNDLTYLSPGNLFRLDLMIWTLTKDSDYSSIRRCLDGIRQVYFGKILFILNEQLPQRRPVEMANYYKLQKIDTPLIYSINGLENNILERYTLTNLANESCLVSDWETSFRRDEKLKNILGDKN